MKSTAELTPKTSYTRLITLKQWAQYWYMTLQYQEQPRKPILSHVMLMNIARSFFCLKVSNAAVRGVLPEHRLIKLHNSVFNGPQKQCW